MSRSFYRAGAAVLTALAINGCSDASAPSAPTAPITPPLTSVTPAALRYSGEAWAAQVRVPTLGINTRVSQAGPLPAGGGNRSNAVAAYSNALLQLEVLAASTSAGGSVAQSQAKVNRTKITVPGVVILIEILQAFTRVECVGPGNLSKSGSTVITSITINGQKTAVSGAPNQVVPFPGGTMTINEQIVTANAIVVNGIHIKAPGLLNLILSHAKSDIHNC